MNTLQQHDDSDYCEYMAQYVGTNIFDYIMTIIMIIQMNHMIV